MATNTAPLTSVIDLARPIVERIVWATVASTGPGGRPRTRLMHPVWFWDGDRPTALVSARPTPLKRAHLEHVPSMSCFYWDPQHATVSIDADAHWVEDRVSAWNQVKAVAEPVGFDPAMIWPDGPESDDCAFIHLTAHRIVATEPALPGLRWNAPQN